MSGVSTPLFGVTRRPYAGLAAVVAVATLVVSVGATSATRQVEPC